jgi:hypothetical protein
MVRVLVAVPAVLQVIQTNEDSVSSQSKGDEKQRMTYQV